MSDEVRLELAERKVTGKAVKHLRKEGVVPAVIHDHGKPSVHVSAKYVPMLKAYQQAGKHHPLELTVGSQKYTALIKDAEFEPRKNRLNHVVFGAVKANEKVTTEIPIRLSEEIPAEKLSLVVITQLDAISVEALPKNLPDEIVVDASSLAQVGDKLTVADVPLPSGVTLADEDMADQLIAVVYEPSALAAANDAAGGTAEAEEAAEVPAEHEGENEVIDPNRKDEIRPGGKEEKEDKEQGRNPEKK